MTRLNNKAHNTLILLNQQGQVVLERKRVLPNQYGQSKIKSLVLVSLMACTVICTVLISNLING